MKKREIPITSWPLKGKVWIDPRVELGYHRKVLGVPKIDFPRFCIICYQPQFVEKAVDKYHAKLIENLLSCGLYEFNYQNQRIGIIRSNIGGPMTALILERLIVRGMKYFLNIGIAGALTDQDINPGDLVLCTKARRNEGTSYYYLKPSQYSFPDKKLTNLAEKVLREERIPYKKGPTITIDAPYQFPISKARELRRGGVITSDMEAAAVFAVSKYRKVKSAAIFTISDLATKDFKWVPKFHAKELRQGMENLFKICVKVLGSMR